MTKFEVEGLENLKVDLNDFHDCWWFLYHHPYFFFQPSGRYEKNINEPGFKEDLDIHVTRICPLTNRVEEDPAVNTLTEIWLEVGGWLKMEIESATGQACHDYRLDVGGATFEEAIKNLAAAVLAQEGSYPEHTTCSHCYKTYPAGPTDDNEDSFCSPLCEEHGVTKLVTEPISGSPNLRYVPTNEHSPCCHFPADE